MCLPLFSPLTRLLVLLLKVKALFNELGVTYHAIELDQIENGDELHSVLKAKVGKTSVPQVFVNRNHVGGCDDTYAAQESGRLGELLKAAQYDYDLIVIGGGSGGLAASKVSHLRDSIRDPSHLLIIKLISKDLPK